MIISINDKRWLKRYYPKLFFNNFGSLETIEGLFEFSAYFDRESKNYIVNPSSEKKIGKNYLTDSYKIRIKFPNNNIRIPEVMEISGRITEVAAGLGIPLIDMHISEDGTGCLLGKLDETQEFNLQTFINGPVLQFFYDQSYFEKYNIWPRGTYSHGYLGIIENYYDNLLNGKTNIEEVCFRELKKYNQEWSRIKKLLEKKKRICGHWPCICESKIEFRNCHTNVFKGLWALQSYYKNNKLQ